MKSLAQAFQPLAVTVGVQAACVAAGVLFLCWGLGAPQGTEGAFAAACIGLFWAGLLGPFVYTRVHGDGFWAPPVRGALRCALLGLTAASVCAVYAALTRGPIGAAFVQRVDILTCSQGRRESRLLTGGKRSRPRYALA